MRAAVVFALAVVAVASAAIYARAQVGQPGQTYPTWEYRTETIRDRTTQELNDATLNALGRDGWELAGLTRREIRVQDLLQTETVYVFKRSRGELRR